MIRHRAGAAAAILLAAGALFVNLVLAQPGSLATVTEFADRQGFVDITITGDAGGKLNIHYDLNGFYVVELPILSGMLKSGNAAAIPGIADNIVIYPRQTRVKVNGRLTHSSSFEDGRLNGRPRTDCWLSEVGVNHEAGFTAADKSVYEAVFRESRRENLKAPFSFMIEDRRKAGGGVSVASFQVTDLAPEPMGIAGSGTFTDFDAPGAVDRRTTSQPPFSFLVELGPRSKTLANDAGVSAQSRGYLNFRVGHTAPQPLPATFSAAAPEFSGEFRETIPEPPAGLKRCSYLQTDESFTVDVKYGVSLSQTIDATIEPVDPGEAAWTPEALEVRSFKIHLKNPDHAGVSRVRATIGFASAHPGITTNAGMHNLTAPDCPYCTRVMRREPHSVTESFHGVPVTRNYRGISACELDTSPDIFFRQEDNPDFTLVAPATANLKKPIAQVIESTAGPASDDVIVKVFVADYAASARLTAEVEIGGRWLPVKAIGSTADPLGSELMLPVDRNSDGVADHWAASHGNGRADDDTDAEPNAAKRGDGLTVFEEYRGVLEMGFRQRLDPRRKDLFVADYTGTHMTPLASAGSFYATQHLSVHEVDATEFRSDVINWQPVATRLAPQHIVVLQMNPATPAVVGWRQFANDWLAFAGAASHVNPPEAGHTTVALQYESRRRSPGDVALARTIAHELGHMMGMPHHGEGDGYVDEVPDPSGVSRRQHLAAVRGGQHSGDEACIMRYRNADLLCKMPSLVPYSPASYDPWPQPPIGNTSICTSRTGAGINAGTGAGDATHGNCMAQLRVKSGQR
jgi:hypothetical protein